MMKSCRLFALLCFVIQWPWQVAWAFGLSFTQMPQDLDQVEVSLHTVDVGNLVYNNFGHTAIRVRDRATRQDLVFNWGIFDFRDPISFSLRFYRGELDYKLGIYSFASVMDGYQFERRTVWEDVLDLSREQKEILLKRLIWNAAKENRTYAYQYFFDNCSTRPRDYIDEALGGQLRRNTERSLSPLAFRDMVYDGFKYNPGLDVLLDVGTNSRTDRQMSDWERMFHPLALREILLATAMDGRPLVKESRVLVEVPQPREYKDLAYPVLLVGFGVPLAILAFLFFFGVQGAWVYRSLGLVGFPLLSLGALLGFLMPVTWVVSAHVDLHHNANQILFWPLDFLFLGALASMAIQGRPLRLGVRCYRWARWYLLLHLLVSLLLPLFFVFGIIQQNVGRVCVYLLPIYLILLFLMYRMGLRAQEGGLEGSKQ